MKPLIIYHANCTDGFGAAFCAWLKFGDEAEYIPMNYGEQSQFDVANREVYILDFSFPKEVMEHILEYAKRVIWLDHHKTAFENWADDERQLYVDETEYTHIVLDNDKSGAMLAWEHFHPEQEIPDFIRFIDDRDRWQWKYENSAAFHAGMASRKPWTFEQWHTLNISDGGFYRAIDEGIVLLKAQDAQVKSIAKHAMKCIIIYPDKVRGAHSVRAPWKHRVSGPNHMGYFDEAFADGLAVNTSVHMSEVGHELANRSGTFGLIWYLGENGQAKVSLRSNGDYDVSAIAKQFGGGGHRNAAGFSIDVQTLLGWLK